MKEFTKAFVECLKEFFDKTHPSAKIEVSEMFPGWDIYKITIKESGYIDTVINVKYYFDLYQKGVKMTALRTNLLDELFCAARNERRVS